MDDTSTEWHRRQAAFMHVKPGDKIAYARNGVTRTHTVSSVTYRDGDYVPAAQRTVWQKVVRALTPRRWRKPLPQLTRKPGQVTVNVGVHAPTDALARHAKTLQDMQAMLGGFNRD